MRPRFSELILAVLVLATSAHAKEVVRTHGVVLELSGFYKGLLSGVLLQPDSVTSSRSLLTLFDEARGTPGATTIPEGGFLSAHVFRVNSRVRFDDRVQLDVAWQLALSLASDPLLAGTTSLSTTVGGTGPGAQRRLVEGAGTLASGSSWRMEHNLDRLALKVALPFGDLTVGRQVLSWGTGRFWNPTDVLSPFPPTVIDREVRRGFDAVRMAIALGEVTQLDVLYLPQLKPEDMGGVVRFQTNVKGWDGSVSAGKYVGDLVFGADVVGDLGPVGVHAEGAYTVPLVGLGTNTVSIGEHFFRGVIGGEVKPHAKVVLMAEYSFNGAGTNRPSEYAKVLSSPRYQRGELFGASRHQAAIAASFIASDLLSMSLAALGNLSDPSVMLIPSLEYSFTQTVLIRAGAYVPIGRTPDPQHYAALTVDDVRMNSEAFQAAVATRGLRSEYGAGSYGAFVQVGVYVP